MRADDAVAVRLPGDLLRVGQRLGHRGEEARHGLGLGEAMRSARRRLPELFRGHVLQGGVQVDGAQQGVQPLIAIVEEHRVLHGGGRRPRSRAKPARAEKGRP